MICFPRSLRLSILGAAMTALLAVGASAASLGVGTVNADALRLRGEASTEATVLATAAKGDAVVILEETAEGWYKVDYKSVEGFMSAEFLEVQETADVKIGYGMVKTDGATLNMRGGAGTDFEKVAVLNNGAVVDIVGIDSGWYKVTYNGTTGYVSSDFMITVKDSAGSRGAEGGVSSNSDLGAQIVEYAKQFIGCKYAWGGNGPTSFDCSGFTKYVYSHFGYTLNRTATDQLSNGVSVSKDQLQPGDLVFFRYNTSKPVSHVGIYIGGGQFVHASTNSYEVQIDDLTSGHYSRVYVYGRHVI